MIRQANRCRSLVLSAGLSVSLGAPAHAQQVTTTFLGTGNWSQASLWSTGPAVPNNGSPPGTTYAVLIPATSQPVLDIDATVDSLSLLGNILNIGNFTTNHTLTVLGDLDASTPYSVIAFRGGTLRQARINLGTTSHFVFNEAYTNILEGVTINGDITDQHTGPGRGIFQGGLTLNGTMRVANLDQFILMGNQTISGNATILLAPEPGLGVTMQVRPGTLQLASSVVVRGTGLFTGETLISTGRFTADRTDGPLVVSATSLQMNGIAEAINGATLRLGNSVAAPVTGLFRATPGSTLQFDGTWDLRSATLDTAGGNVKIAGTLVNDGSTIAIGPNSGTWSLTGGQISGGTVTTAPGSVLTSVFNSRLTGVQFSGSLSILPARTLQFSGDLAGSVSLPPTAELNFNAPSRLSASISGGGLVRLSSTLDNSGRVLEFNSTTTPWLFDFNSVLRGGTLRLRNGAAPQLSTSFSATPRFDGITLDGTWDLTPGPNQPLEFTGGLSGSPAGSGLGISNRTLRFTGSQTVSGLLVTGGDLPANVTISAGSTLTLDPATTWRTGQWLIASTGGSTIQANLVNNGQIIADSPGRTLEIVTTASGSGSFIARNGGTLFFSAGTLTGGLITAEAGSTVRIINAVNSPALTLDARAGVISLENRFTNTGATLALSPATGSPVLRAVLQDGLVTTTPDVPLLAANPAQLVNVDFRGRLDIQSGSVRQSGGSSQGVINIGAGRSIIFSEAWTSSSTINTLGGAVELGGQFYLSPDMHIVRSPGDVIALTGRLFNSAQTLTLDSSTGSWRMAGEIVGGTLRLRDGAILDTSDGGSLVGLTLDGTLRVGSAALEPLLRITSGISGGSLELTTRAASIRFIGANTVAATQISALSSSGTETRMWTDEGAELTLDAASIVRGGRLQIGDAYGSTTRGSGRINCAGSILSEAAGQTIRITSLLTVNTGVMSVSPGATLLLRAPQLGTGARLFRNDSLLSIQPGGICTVQEAFTQTALGVLQIGLDTAGGVPSSGLLSTTGDVSLDGTLRLAAAPTFTPRLGDIYHLLSLAHPPASAQWSFDLPALPAPLAWDTSAILSTGNIGIVPAPATGLPLLMVGLLTSRRRR